MTQPLSSRTCFAIPRPTHPAVWLILLACLGGCTHPKNTAAPPPPDARPCSAAELLSLRDRHGVYRYTEGKHAGKDVPFAVEPDGDAWRLTIDGIQVDYLKAEADGSVSIVREIDLGEQVQVEYEPALVMAAHLEPGVPVEQISHMTIRRLSDGSVREEGQCKFTLTLLGPRTINTPAGKLRVQVLHVKREMRLSLARVAVTSTEYYVPGRGEVMEKSVQSLRPLNLLPVVSKEEFQLVEEPPAPSTRPGAPPITPATPPTHPAVPQPRPATPGH